MDPEDKHSIVRVIHVDEEYVSQDIEDIAAVDSHYFETDKLSQFCFITITANEETCQHSTNMFVSIHRRTAQTAGSESCPHGTTVHCYTEEDQRSFLEEMAGDGWDEVVTSIPVNLDRNYDYVLSIQHGEEAPEQIGFASYDDVLDNGTLRVGSIQAFPLPNCADAENIQLVLTPSNLQQDSDGDLPLPAPRSVDVMPYLKCCETAKKGNKFIYICATHKFV